MAGTASMVALARGAVVERRGRAPGGAGTSGSVTLAGEVRFLAGGDKERVYAATTAGLVRVDFAGSPPAVVTVTTDPAGGVALVQSGAGVCAYFTVTTSREVRRHCRGD